MTLRLLYLLTFIALFVNGHSQMRQVYTDSKADNEIVKISFYAPSQGYVAFNDGLGFTNDSGRTFTKKPITLSNVDYNSYSVNLTFGFTINGVKAFSQDTLLAYGHYGLVPAVLRSVNGGSNFKLIFLSQFDPLQLRTGITDMIFPQNGSIGFAVDADRILKTTDRGQSWSANLVSPGSYFDYLEAADNNNVFAFSTAYNNNRLIKTVNGGANWQMVTLPAGQQLIYAHFITPAKGWINAGSSSNGGRIYYTSDGGSSWTLKNNPAVAPFFVKKMRFVNDSTGFALSDLFEVYKTTDSGKIWQRLARDNQFSYLGYSFNDLQLWNASQLWAGGGHGFLEISNNGGGTPIPAVYFQIDTTGMLASGTVNLVNYSKPGYQYQWFVNNAPAGNSYHSSYTHNIFSLLDSIKLIVSNGIYTDSLVKYQYFNPPVIVSSFTPVIGGSGTVVQIKGQHFTNATGVSFGSVAAASFTVLSDSTIRAVVGNGASGSIQVVTPTGYGSLSGFSFVPPPVISSFAPTTAKAGTTVIITGQNFNNVTAVSFGAVAAASYTVISSTSISAVTGVGASGSVSVTAAGGVSVLPGFITIPDIISFTPTSGTFGSYITITGTGFTGVTAVKIGAMPVSSFTVNGHTSITAIAGSGATGDITVSAPGGDATLGAFTYYPAPVISSFAPLSGAVGTTVTINGSNFSTVPAENIVWFGGIRATVTASTSTAITVTVPASAGFAPITVTTHNLTASSSQSFTASFANGGSVTDSSFIAGPPLNVTGTNQTLSNPVIADIDGDGKPDIAGVSTGSYVNQQGVVVYLNTGTGTTLSFTPGTVYAIPHPGGIALADLDGDGKLDIAVTDNDGYNAYIFRNTSTPGAVSFDSAFVFTSAQMKQKIAIADLDADGKPDLVFATWWEGKMIIHRNISNPGKLAFGPRIDIAGPPERNMIIRDLDGDGKPELLDANRFFKNTSTRGTISFASPVSYSPYTHSYVGVGDIDGDGKPDIVTSDPYGSKAAVYRNTSTGTISMATVVLLDAVSLPFGIELNDYDGDGKIDIATPLSNFLAGVLKNTSSPGVISFAPNIGFLPGNYPADIGIVSGDLNNDGRPDIIVSSQILLNNVRPEPFIQSFTPTLAQTGTTVTITGANFTGVTAVTFGGVPAASFTINSPTSITAIVGNGATGDVTVTSNVGTAIRHGFVFGIPPVITNFSPSAAAVGATVTIAGTGFSTTTLNNAVFFGSSKATVLAATATSLTVTVPAGSVYAPISVTVNGLTAYTDKPFVSSFSSPAAGITNYSFADTTRFGNLGGNGSFIDADGDGKLDFIVMGTNTIQLSRNTSTLEKFSFDPNYYSLTTGTNPSRIGFGDIDGDGKQDIVVTHAGSTFVSVFLNKSVPGSFSFATRADLATGYATSGYGPVIKDLDMDGKPDIVVAGYDPRTVSVFRNLSLIGQPNFALRIDYGLDGYPTAVDVQDIDGDKLPELIAAVNGPDEVSVFRNTSLAGTISFALKTDFAVGAWPQSITAGDLNNDGKTDLAIANINGNSVSMLQNTSTPGTISFTKTDLPVNYRPWTVWINDLDGDGKADLAIQKESSNSIFSNARSVSLYKNNSTTGNITLAQPVAYEAGDYTFMSSSCDINGDGKPDIAVFSSYLNYGAYLLIFKNKVGVIASVKVCPNGNAAVVSNIAGATYQWQQNTGSGFANISNNANFQGVTKDTLQLNNVPASWNGYLYRCIAGTDTSIAYTLSINTAAIAIAGADTTICAGSAGIVIGSAATDGNTYSWSPATGLNSPSIANPVANPANSTSYTVMVTNGYGCSSKDTVAVTVKTIATPVVSAGGPVAFCVPGNVQLSSSATTGNQWLKDGAIIQNAVAQTYTAAESGNYSVKVTDISSGCSAASAAATVVTAYQPPTAAAVSAAGPTSFCQGDNVTLSSSDTGTHQWFKDGVMIAGATAKTYLASQSGNYFAKVLRATCSSPASNTITVSVNNAIATPTVSFIGSTSICNGDSIKLTSSASSSNQWYKDSVAIAGAVQATYEVKLAGNYTVRATNGVCMSNASGTTSIKIIPIPAAPVIVQNGAILQSSSAAGNQWFLNGMPINGATGQSFTATTNGGYSAKLTVNGCTGPLSNQLSVTLPEGIKIGPNPVRSKLTIWYVNNTDPLTVSLFDTNGQPVFRSSTTFTGYYEINMSNLATGLYIVEIKNTVTGEKQRKVVIKI